MCGQCSNRLIVAVDGYQKFVESRVKRLQVKSARHNMMEKSPGAGIVAKKVLTILKKRNPKPGYVVGKGVFLITFLLKFLPEKLAQTIIRNIYISRKT